jgi:hypothetical protein
MRLFCAVFGKVSFAAAFGGRFFCPPFCPRLRGYLFLWFLARYVTVLARFRGFSVFVFGGLFRACSRSFSGCILGFSAWFFGFFFRCSFVCFGLFSGAVSGLFLPLPPRSNACFQRGKGKEEKGRKKEDKTQKIREL